MQNLVRVASDQHVITNAAIDLRGPDGEWVDVRRAVQKVTVDLTVGEVSRAHLDLILVDSTVEALTLDDATQAAFAHALREHGWKVTAPKKRPQHRTRRLRRRFQRQQAIDVTHMGSRTKTYVRSRP